MSTVDGCSVNNHRRNNKVKEHREMNGASGCRSSTFACYLRAPKFDGPVKRGGDEEMREVDRPASAVTAQPSHWTMVAFKHLSDAGLTVTHTQDI